MKAAVKGSYMVGMGILAAFVVACGGRPARAADEPLLVVVEVAPGLDVDAAEIRRAIGAELRSETIAQMKSPDEPPRRALIIALDRDRISMSLRANDAVRVARVIPAPAEHAARLRAIVWLAGNLARDQVTPIVAETPLATPPLATIPPAAGLTPDTEPPQLAVITGPGSDVSAISTQARDTRISAPHLWTIGAADGPTTNFPLCKQPGATGWPTPCAPLSVYGTAWRLELQRRARSEGFFEGAALEGTAGSTFSPQLIGAAAFVGSSRRLARWTFESTFGVGLELSSIGTSVLTATQSSSSGFVSNITTSPSLRPALSADGAVAVAHPILGGHGRRSSRGGARIDRRLFRLVPLGHTRAPVHPAVKSRPQTQLAEAPLAVASAVFDEPSLIAGLGDGNLAALAAAFDRWHQRVRVIARRLLSDPAAAEDVVQEVFTALPRAIGRFRGDADLETFLLGIAVKRVRRHRRAALRRRKALERLRTVEPRGPVDPEEDAYRRQLGARLAEALDQLPLPQRVAFVLCEVEELTSVQAAVIAGAPEATIRTRLFHARRRLRDLLAAEQLR